MAGFHLRVCVGVKVGAPALGSQGCDTRPGAGNRGSRLSEFSRVSPRLPPPNSWPGRRHSQGWGAAGDPAGPRRERGVNRWAREWQGGQGLPAWPLCPQPLPCPRACLGNGGTENAEAGKQGRKDPLPSAPGSGSGTGAEKCCQGGCPASMMPSRPRCWVTEAMALVQSGSAQLTVLGGDRGMEGWRGSSAPAPPLHLPWPVV